MKAVDGVDLTIQEGRTLGIVGESGSGKTTVARAIAGLAPTTSGSIALRGKSSPGAQRDANGGSSETSRWSFRTLRQVSTHAVRWAIRS